MLGEIACHPGPPRGAHPR